MQSLAPPCCSGQFATRSVRLPAHSSRLRVRAEVTAPPPAQKIRIKLKSYHPELLSESVEQIQQAADTTGATVAGPVPLPNRRRIYTVLRSPHVNKDSREQFQIITHSRLLDVKNLSAQTIDRLMQLDLPAGVDVEVKL